jgi:hypothetical protein
LLYHRRSDSISISDKRLGATQRLEPESREAASEVPLQIYRTTGFWLLFGGAVGIAMIILGLVVPIHTWLADDASTIRQKVSFSAFGIGDIAMGSYIVASLLCGRVILYANAIENVGMWKTRRLAKEDIIGKMVISAGSPMITLYPRARRQRKLMISVTFTTDKTFDNWMGEIPNITRAALRARTG